MREKDILHLAMCVLRNKITKNYTISCNKNLAFFIYAFIQKNPQCNIEIHNPLLLRCGCISTTDSSSRWKTPVKSVWPNSPCDILRLTCPKWLLLCVTACSRGILSTCGTKEALSFVTRADLIIPSIMIVS